MRSFPNRIAAFIPCLCICLSGCRTAVNSYVGPSIAGLAFAAEAFITGPNRDTLSVSVVARNKSKSVVSVELDQCSHVNPVVAIAISEHGSWSSRDWEIASTAKARAAANSRVEEVCAGGVLSGSYPPGSTYTVVQRVPLAEILGDSLSAGNYRIAASLDINGRTVRNLSAGSVAISPGPPPNTR